MKTLTLIAVFIFLGVLFPFAPSSAAITGSAGGGSGGQNITPMNLAPPNITPANITPLNMAPPNIIPATSNQAGQAHLEHFQEGLAAAQRTQQKAWEDGMADRQKALDHERMAAAEAAEAAQIAPAAGDSAAKPAPYKPSAFLVGVVDLVNMFAAGHHKDKAADAP